jgi:hypothetical protein
MRLALCLIVSAVLAYSVLNYRNAVAHIRPPHEVTAYSCPACGFIEERLLTPSSRCSRCGKPVFADRERHNPVLATTIDSREDTE